MTTYPWSPGSATGIGSLPGTDIGEAVRMVTGELPLPYLPELPARGPGADMIGRSAGLLVEMPVELYAARWRIASHPGRDLRRTHDLWSWDLDALMAALADYEGPVKLQAAGPWTLAAALERPIGGRMLADPGAVRDLAASLAEGIAAHVRDVSARLPRAQILFQLDEPSLPAVLAGRVPTESGFGRVRAVDASVARDALRQVISLSGVPVVVHCCAPDVPLGLIREAGAVAVALDLALVGDLDALGEVLDAGMGLFAGAVPAVRVGSGGASTSFPASGSSSAAFSSAPGPISNKSEISGKATGEAGAARDGASARDASDHGDDVEDSPLATAATRVSDRVRRLWRDLGFSTNQLAEQVVVTPSCGLAGASPARARTVTAVCREAARRLT